MRHTSNSREYFHFILAGLSIPIWYWRDCEREIGIIKKKYYVEQEIHVAWILRPYFEQTHIPDFEQLTYDERRRAVESKRTTELLRLQRANNPKLYRQTKKNNKKTEPYIHLSYTERRNLITELAECISKWEFARLFAECIDKVHFDPSKSAYSIDEQAFDQIVSRFEQYLSIISKSFGVASYGLLIHDNNETVAKKHTELMKKFYKTGTRWTALSHIIETPLFVDSQLTSMVQVADLCGYALRRYLENGESFLFNFIFSRADRKDGVVVGVRHFTTLSCTCAICLGHRPRSL
ncbi:MAG TPA: DUF3800 domain-containing protein [bacterium]|nr:DUF3800 domain-containing protein [bacterium]